MAGVKVNGTKGADKIFIEAGNDTINAGNGNDTIYSGGGDDVITGGKGDNTIYLTNPLDLNGTVGFGKEVINLTKGENLTLVTEKSIESAKIVGKDVVLSLGTTGESVTLKNFASKDVVGSNGSVLLKRNDDDVNPIDLKDYLFAGGAFNKKGAYSGSWLSEDIDASNIETAYDKNGVKGVSIKAGAGNDNITGSKFNDTITGGVGNNTINIDLSEMKKFGDDTIVLTKNENLVINVTGAGQYREDFLKQYETTVDGKDFIVKFYSGARDNNGVYPDNSYLGSIRLKNFVAKNVVGENGSVVINIPELNNTSFNLTDEIFKIGSSENPNARMVLYSTDQGITSWVKKGVINGTRLGEEFNANGYAKEGDKGVTINAGGGDDRVNGSVKADKINGGDGNDSIVGGFGNDTIYGGNGDDTLEGYGDNDALYGGKGDDYLCADAGDDKLYGEAGNDEMYGGDGKDTLYGGDGDDEMYAGKNDDFVYGGKGNDTLNGGDGNDTFVFYKKDGADVVEDATYVDVIKFADRTNFAGLTFEQVKDEKGKYST